jgi:RHS repeat-associated protein
MTVGAIARFEADQTSGVGINALQVAINPSNNRLYAPADPNHDVIDYDDAGNQTKDYLSWNGTRAYDAENRMTSATDGDEQTSIYTYDGDGRRVVRNVNGTETWQVYGISGELLAEYQPNADPTTPNTEYGYRNGELLVKTEEPITLRDPGPLQLGTYFHLPNVPNNPNIPHVDPGPGPTWVAALQWLVTDQLGTPRMIFDQTGALANVKRHDYLPFGEELVAGQGLRTTGVNGLGYTGDSVRQKFTSKEHDNETGLDYFLARYYSSTHGRFTSPDEFIGGPDELFSFAEVASANPTFYADLGNPQSLNKYPYTYNNPLRYTDRDGHCPDGQPCPGLIIPTPNLINGGIGGAKALGNILIGMNNVSADFGIPGTKHIEPYKADNFAQAVGMVVTNDVSIFGALLGGRAQIGGVAIADGETTAVVASEVGNASGAKTTAQMAGELSDEIGKNSVSYRTPNKVGHIDLKGKSHFDKPTGQLIPTPHVQERVLNRSPGGGRVNTGAQTTRRATKQDIRTAREIIERRENR